jgi:cathepsin A (carboxypeptidase C)
VIEDKSKANINLKGVYIGNGFLNKDLNTDSMIQFAYHHGIMSEHDWDFMERTCCGGCSDFCKFHKATGGKCEHLVQGTIQFMWNGGLNPYDLYRDCAFAKNSTRHRVMMRGLAPEHVRLAYESEMRNFDPSRNLMATGPPCMNDGPIEAYLNRADVRAALHIPNSVPRWTVCSDAVSAGYQMQYGDMKDKLKEIIAAKKRVLIYNGDTDMACNFLLGTRFIMELGIEFEHTKLPFKHGKQIAGFWTKYEGLDFITIKGAGHMAPQWRPAATFHMMYRYVKNQPYN